MSLSSLTSVTVLSDHWSRSSCQFFRRKENTNNSNKTLRTNNLKIVRVPVLSKNVSLAGKFFKFFPHRRCQLRHRFLNWVILPSKQEEKNLKICFAMEFNTHHHPQPFTRYPPPATRHPLPATSHPPPATRHPPPATRHPPPATRHPPPATRHPPPAIIVITEFLNFYHIHVRFEFYFSIKFYYY